MTCWEVDVGAIVGRSDGIAPVSRIRDVIRIGAAALPSIGDSLNQKAPSFCPGGSGRGGIIGQGDGVVTARPSTAVRRGKIGQQRCIPTIREGRSHRGAIDQNHDTAIVHWIHPIHQFDRQGMLKVVSSGPWIRGNGMDGGGYRQAVVVGLDGRSISSVVDENAGSIGFHAEELDVGTTAAFPPEEPDGVETGDWDREIELGVGSSTASVKDTGGDLTKEVERGGADGEGESVVTIHAQAGSSGWEVEPSEDFASNIVRADAGDPGNKGFRKSVASVEITLCGSVLIPVQHSGDHLLESEWIVKSSWIRNVGSDGTKGGIEVAVLDLALRQGKLVGISRSATEGELMDVGQHRQLSGWGDGIHLTSTGFPRGIQDRVGCHYTVTIQE